MTHHPPKLPLGRRIIAAGCAAIWLVGVSACNLGALFCCDSPAGETVAHADQEHSPDAHSGSHHAHEADSPHSPEADSHPHDSPQHDSQVALCCSTLKAVAQTAKPDVFSKPASQPISFLCVPGETPAASLARSANPPIHPAKSHERVFMPEVCLGPAFRSHAPPACV